LIFKSKQAFSKQFRRIIGIFMLSFCLLSCWQQNKKNETFNFFNIDKFKLRRDTLYINSQFTECGEWGGHRELSKVFFSGKNFYINYQKFNADCNSVKRNKGKLVQKLVKNITKKISDNDKVLIYNYVHQLLDAKFQEPIGLQVGRIFQVVLSDNDLNISVYPGSSTTEKQYLELIKKIIN
jgi:hypothetical protein